MLVLIEQHLRQTRKTWARNLQRYVWSRVDGTSSRQTGDNGVGDTLICPVIYFRQKVITFPVWVQFINLCDKTAVFLRQIAYQESNIIQCMNPRTKVSQQEYYQSILSRTISTIVHMQTRFVPLAPFFHWDLPISIVSNL